MNDLQVSFTSIVESEEDFPVDFDDAWVWIGYSKKDKALDALFSIFEEGLDFTRNGGKSKEGPGRPMDSYFLTKDCLKEFCMLARTDKGKEVRKYFIDCEKRYLSAMKSSSAVLDKIKELIESVRKDDVDLSTALYEEIVLSYSRYARDEKKDKDSMKRIESLVRRQEEVLEKSGRLDATYIAYEFRKTLTSLVDGDAE